VHGVIILRSRNAPHAVSEAVDVLIEAMPDLEPERPPRGYPLGEIRNGEWPEHIVRLAKLRDRLGLPVKLSDAQMGRIRASVGETPGRTSRSGPQWQTVPKK
jgi:hypothetical protein